MRTRNGFIVVFVLIMLLLIVLALMTLFVISYNDLATANTESKAMRAYYLAEAGIAKKFMQLRDGNTANITAESFALNGGADNGQFTVTVSPNPPAPFPVYTLTSTGTYPATGSNKISRTVKLTLKQVSYSTFGYMSNSEDAYAWASPIWFVTGDILSGPVHSNDQFNISGNPIFNGPVSSTAATINYNHGGPPNDNPQFNDSLTLGAAGMQMPQSSTVINDITTAAQHTGQSGPGTNGSFYTTGDTRIALLSNGTMNVSKKNSHGAWLSPVNYPNPPMQSVYVNNGDVYISGIMKGQLTVGTSDTIYITDSILYNTDPITNPNSTDILSLVSQTNVYVSQDAPGPDVTIDAYIIAFNSFGVDNYAGIPVRGTLHLYGGITQTKRAGVGTFNSQTNQKVSGYTKDYKYDDRLVFMVPPYFPAMVDANGRIVYKKVIWSEI